MAEMSFREALMRGVAGVSRRIFDEAPPVGAPRAFHSRQQLSDFLPYRQWDSTRELYQQGSSIGFILEIVPLIGADESTTRNLEELLTQTVPQGAFVQIISYASPKIGEVIDPWARLRAANGGVFEELGRHRYEHFQRAAWTSASRQAPFYFRDFRIFLALEMVGSLSSTAAEALMEAREQFIAGFKTIRSHAAVVRPDQLIRLVGDILNPTTNVRPTAMPYSPDRWLNEQMVRSDTTWTIYRDRIEAVTRAESDEFLLTEDQDEVAISREAGGRDEHFQIRGFSVRQFPEAFTQGQMNRLLGDMFNDQLRLIGPTIMSLCFTPMSPEKTRNTAEMKRMRTNQAASNPIGRMFPETRKAAEDWAMVMEDVAEGALLARMGFFVLSVAPYEMGERAERSLRSVFRASRFTLQRDDDIHFQTVLACLPLGLAGGLADDLDKFGRTRRMPTTVAARLSPLQGEFLGSEVPHMLLVGRRGQVFYHSIFGNKEGNHNTAVVGSSGSGKSVWMQECAASLRGAGAEVFVIDDGFSFMNSCKLLGGAFIRFSLDHDICINPFSIVDYRLAERDKEYAADCREMIAQTLEQAARGDQGCTPNERGCLSEAVASVWEAMGPDGSFDAVVSALEKGDFGEVGRDLAQSLHAFTTSGVYGPYFNGKANLEISNSYTTFEMSDLESKKDLRAVVVLVIMMIVRQRMRKGGRELKKALIIDEAWQLLANGAMGKFIEGFARRCRKEGGALVTGTQSLNDYYKTDGSRACIENSDHTIILRLKPEALDQLRTNDRLGVDEATLTILKSLKVVDGEYSEMFVIGPDGRFPARLVLDPYSVTMYSTKPAVFAAIQKLVAEGVPLQEAIARIAFKNGSARPAPTREAA